MKIKRSKKPACPEFTVVRLFHSQGIKQSQNYQSIEATAGIELSVSLKAGESVEAAQKAAEQMVEKQLERKFKEQRELLAKM